MTSPVFGGPDSPDVGEYLAAIAARPSRLARFRAFLRRLFRRRVDWDNDLPWPKPATVARDLQQLDGDWS